jgi:hypothetical protein
LVVGEWRVLLYKQFAFRTNINVTRYGKFFRISYFFRLRSRIEKLN